MRTKSFVWALPILAMTSISSYAAMPSAPNAVGIAYNMESPLPLIMNNDGPYHIEHLASYDQWSVLVGQHYASLFWLAKTPTPSKTPSSFGLYITPAKDMITIDVIARKKEYRELKLPFITWNIKDVSVSLNKTYDKHGWVIYSTAVYTDNIDKLTNALRQNTPMTLNLSSIHSIPIDTNGLSGAITNLENVIRQNNLIAPQSIALHAPKPEDDLPLDGMSPDVFPLYKKTNSYIQKCLDMGDTQARRKARYNICMKRNDLLTQMKTKGWCWGSGDPSEHDKGKIWRKCILTPQGFVPKLHDLQKTQNNTQPLNDNPDLEQQLEQSIHNN